MVQQNGTWMEFGYTAISNGAEWDSLRDGRAGAIRWHLARVWDGRRIISQDWVEQSLTPFIKATDGFEYGYKWWLYPRKGAEKYVW